MPEKPRRPRVRTHDSLRGKFGPSRERYESSGKNPKAQPARSSVGQALIIALMSLSRPILRAVKIQLSGGGGYAQKRRRRRQIAAHLPRERASLRTRNNALVARRVIKNHAYAVHTITILPSFPKATPPSTLRQCTSILAWLQ